ncbi:hypothetical protein [Sphingobacterium yanglingense]|uniref:RiboL-PSP-HEPN domain-containing protein n=1 Tax=Sphingobacterium yanglingense TaxID=1437280 RepID=A0A4R6W549_9SPHI|nr:hypothetical protein [Sphingobacterium yanglingense]TDQ73837.1 hypothetical protein CLV99_4274 [Sphingobacterium yanglingense]
MENISKANKASQAFINAGVEFESIERILLYLRVSNSLINEDILKSVKKLTEFNSKLELSYELDAKREEDFLKVNHYERMLSIMMYIRLIDNFESYFKDILSEIVFKNPKVLSSNETEKLDFILSFDDYPSLIKEIASKRIEALFYQNIDNIQKFFKERVGIQIFKEKADDINLLIKQRNLAVHNRSKITKEFIRLFPNKEFVEGMVLKFDFAYIERLIPALYKIINELDYEICAKFDLKEVEY